VVPKGFDCLCGAVRYCVSGSTFAMEYCHCAACVKKLQVHRL